MLEHLGLGRYGDPIDPTGYKNGFANLARLLCPGARFYLSTPIGQERVEFNANWSFDPRTILELASDHGLQLDKFFEIFNSRTGLRQIDAFEQETMLCKLATEKYNLGILFS